MTGQPTRDSGLLDALGGEDAVAEITDALYAELLLDDTLAAGFEGVCLPHLIAAQQRFLCGVLDGKAAPAGALSRVHAPLVARGLDGAHVDAMTSTLDRVLVERGVDAAVRAAVARQIDRLKPAVLGRTATTDQEGNDRGAAR